MQNIGRNIKTLRTGNGMTQDELAEKLFVTRQTISNYETGRSHPDVEMLSRIAAVLETDANTILYGPPAKISKKQEYIKTAICAALLVLLVLPLPWLNQLTSRLQGIQFVIWPRYLLVIYYLPFLLLCLGWTSMQVLSLFTKLTPLPRKNTKWVFTGCLLFIVFYIAVTAQILLPFPKPRWLQYTLYFILGAWPEGFALNWGYLLFPAGSVLWLCGFPLRHR